MSEHIVQSFLSFLESYLSLFRALYKTYISNAFFPLMRTWKLKMININYENFSLNCLLTSLLWITREQSCNGVVYV